MDTTTDVDTSASDMLEELGEKLNAQGTSLVFAELKDPVRAKIERYGLTRTIDPRHFYPTIETALDAFRQETGADWAAAERGPDELTGHATEPHEITPHPPPGHGGKAITGNGGASGRPPPPGDCPVNSSAG